MKCPFCSHLESKVIDTRVSNAGEMIRRRRECEACARRFTSYERVEQPLPFVVKKDGRREHFDRQKVLSGLQNACTKRPVSQDTLQSIVDSVERDLVETEAKEVLAKAIGERVMAHLRSIDEVAYVRFASVYRSFADLEEFRSEVEKLTRTRPLSPEKEFA